jgi:hypothetical protein
LAGGGTYWPFSNFGAVRLPQPESNAKETSAQGWAELRFISVPP